MLGSRFPRKVAVVCFVAAVCAIVNIAPTGLSQIRQLTELHQHQHNHHQCISFEEDDLSRLFKDGTSQVFILMAPKAGGTSLKQFTKKCTPSALNMSRNADNFINYDENLKPFLLSALQPPKLVGSHLYNDKPLVDLIKYGARDSWIIYVYRDETNRLMSAIKEVVQTRLCGVQRPGVFKNLNIQDSPEKCIFDEEPFVKEVLEAGVAELGPSISSQLTCGVWEEIDETGPNILFMHYSKLDALQSNLAKQYCDRPDMQPIKINVDGNRGVRAKKYVIRTKSGEEVLLDNWIEAKRSTIEFALKLSGGSCKHKTRKMEDALHSCGEKAIRVFAAE